MLHFCTTFSAAFELGTDVFNSVKYILEDLGRYRNFRNLGTFQV